MIIKDLKDVVFYNTEILLEGKNSSTWIGKIKDIPEIYDRYIVTDVYVQDDSLIAECKGNV